MGTGTPRRSKPHTLTRQQRGYDAAYDRTRARYKLVVDAGRATCWRCGRWIDPRTEWHLGHDDHDRRIIRGPEHARCNLAAAAHKTNALRRGMQPRRPKNSQRW
jgi:hypothetical protein